MPDDDPKQSRRRRGQVRPNPRQIRFAVEFAKAGGQNAGEAAIRAGYAPHSATSAAWGLLRKPHVRALVDKHMKLEAAAVEVTEQRVLIRAAQWLFATDEEARALGYTITERMRVKALEILARATGLVSPDQHKHQHLHAAPAIQFVIPANDRVPIDARAIVHEGGNGKGNGRDHDPANLPPGAVLELPPKDED